MNLDLKDRVVQCINSRHEGDSWDFKRQWHDKEKEKTKLLHDIICMSNLVQDEDGLIIIGVDEENGYSIQDVKNDPNRKNSHELVEFLRDKPFDGGIRPITQVESLGIDGKIIDIIVVKNSSNVPFYLTKRFEKVESYHIYSRVGDTNTPIDSSADRDKVERLWKKRFGIDKTPKERFLIYLRDYDGWMSVDGQESYFYESFPEFRIEAVIDKNRNGFEYYCLSQINSRPSWYYIRLYYQGNIVEETSGICLDGGRFFSAVPDTTISDEQNYLYAYDSGTLQCELCNFFLNKTAVDYDSICRWRECIPVFESEEEKRKFLKFLKKERIELDGKYDGLVPSILQNGDNVTVFKNQFERAKMITDLLERFRRYQIE